jgi:hypothetical protein
LGGGHLPGQHFAMNAAWFKLALMNYNLVSAMRGLCLDPEERTVRMFIEMSRGIHESSARSDISLAEKIDRFLPSLSGLTTYGLPEPSVETLGYYQIVPTGQNIAGRSCLLSS